LGYGALVLQFAITVFRVNAGMPSCSVIFLWGTLGLVCTLFVVSNLSQIEDGLYLSPFFYVLAMLIKSPITTQKAYTQ
jgi:hypothetical protein